MKKGHLSTDKTKRCTTDEFGWRCRYVIIECTASKLCRSRGRQLSGPAAIIFLPWGLNKLGPFYFHSKAHIVFATMLMLLASVQTQIMMCTKLIPCSSIIDEFRDYFGWFCSSGYLSLPACICARAPLSCRPLHEPQLLPAGATDSQTQH